MYKVLTCNNNCQQKIIVGMWDDKLCLVTCQLPFPPPLFNIHIHRGESKTAERKGYCNCMAGQKAGDGNVNVQSTPSICDGTEATARCFPNPCHMSRLGVDRGDQLRGYYNCRTKSRKFYKYIFYFLLDVTITNAYILYKHCSPHSKIRVKEFR